MKPRYIRVASDLHLEQYFGQKPDFLVKSFLQPRDEDAESVLVLAGDISSKPVQLIPFLKEAEKRFMRVYYIPGNHEFYGHAIETWSKDFTTQMLAETTKTEWATDDVSYEELDGVRFIFTTMWADGGNSIADQVNVARGLRDFYVIRTKGQQKFKVSDMVYMHKKMKQSVLEYLEKPFDGKTVVITHHMPSYRLCHPRFGSECNGGFAANLDPILAGDHAPNLWIHGHTHDTIDTKLWKTRIVCNPAGYGYEYASAYTQFNPKFIEIEKIDG